MTSVGLDKLQRTSLTPPLLSPPLHPIMFRAAVVHVSSCCLPAVVFHEAFLFEPGLQRVGETSLETALYNSASFTLCRI